MRAPGTWPVARLVRTSSDSPSPTLTDCSIHDGAATSPVLARQLLPDKTSHVGDLDDVARIGAMAKRAEQSRRLYPPGGRHGLSVAIP
jgi:hypothetical protein